MTEDFDKTEPDDEDWRKLASFGVERNQVRFTFKVNINVQCVFCYYLYNNISMILQQYCII